jgi:nucleoside-diphosphate kinase
MEKERTFLMVKPDGVKRKLVGEIIGRMEAKGFILAAARVLVLSPTLAEEHYREHRGRPYYRELVEFITSGPVVAMVWEGPGVVELTRRLLGHREPLQALPGTIRGDYAGQTTQNLAHAADSPETAAREIALFFQGPVL